MAGDWLKVEKATPGKPEVLTIASRLQLHPDEAFGKCFRFWCWADMHTTNGHAPGVTLESLDATIGCSGFASALVSVGWLVARGNGLEVPKFDRHMSESEKKRLDNLLRQREFRERNKDVTKPRYERNKPSSSISSSDSSSEEDGGKGEGETVKRFLKPTLDEVTAYCRERGNSIDPQGFLDHYDSNGWRIGGKGAMKDWKAAVRNWERNGFRSNTNSSQAIPMGQRLFKKGPQ